MLTRRRARGSGQTNSASGFGFHASIRPGAQTVQAPFSTNPVLSFSPGFFVENIANLRCGGGESEIEIDQAGMCPDTDRSTLLPSKPPLYIVSELCVVYERASPQMVMHGSIVHSTWTRGITNAHKHTGEKEETQR